jgi:hypothetical protein
MDVCNHKLKAMMDPYLEMYNERIHFAKVLNAARKWQQDLPTLPHFCYANGQPFLCWNSTLGGACTVNVSISGTAAILAPTTSRTTLLTK